MHRSFRIFLCIVISFAVGAIYLSYRYPLFSVVSPHSSDLTSPTVTYTVGLIGDSQIMREVFSSLTEQLKEREHNTHVAMKVIELNVPSDTKSLSNALSYLSDQHVDLIVTGQSEYAFFKAHGLSRPVVVPMAAEPVALGLAATEDGSGNDAVFIDNSYSDTVGRRLEFFLELVPTAKKILVLRGDPTLPGELTRAYGVLQKTADRYGVELIDKRFHTREEFNNFLLTFDFSTVDAVFRFPSAFVATHFDVLASMIPRIRKPVIVANQSELQSGGLLSYSMDLKEMGDHAADVVYDLLTKDLKPSDFPIIHTPRLYLGLNKKQARELGIPTPNSFMKKVDYVVGD